MAKGVTYTNKTKAKVNEFDDVGQCQGCRLSLCKKLWLSSSTFLVKNYPKSSWYGVGVYQKNTTLFDHPISILFIGSDAVTIWTDSFCPASHHGNSRRGLQSFHSMRTPNPPCRKGTPTLPKTIEFNLYQRILLLRIKPLKKKQLMNLKSINLLHLKAFFLGGGQVRPCDELHLNKKHHPFGLRYYAKLPNGLILYSGQLLLK